MSASRQTDPPASPIDKTVVLVGMMGAGKSFVGRRLAARLGLPFIDADEEIEAAAGCSIEDIFALHGEAGFRDGEQRVIARLLDGPPRVLATGGGAFMDATTRSRIRDRGVSVWLRAGIDTLMSRVSRRNHRPLLKTKDRRHTLETLLGEREPVYAEADIVVDTDQWSPRATVDRVIEALEPHLGQRPGQRKPPGRGARG